MKVIERLSKNPMELAKAFVSAVADGCPPEVERCKKEEDGWEACDKCFYKWLLSEYEA